MTRVVIEETLSQIFSCRRLGIRRRLIWKPSDPASTDILRLMPFFSFKKRERENVSCLSGSAKEGRWRAISRCRVRLGCIRASPCCNRFVSLFCEIEQGSIEQRKDALEAWRVGDGGWEGCAQIFQVPVGPLEPVLRSKLGVDLKGDWIWSIFKEWIGECLR